MQVKTLPDLMDPVDLARYLGCHEKTLNRRLQRGEGPPIIRIGRKRFFKRSSVETWLDDLEEPAPRCA